MTARRVLLKHFRSYITKTSNVLKRDSLVYKVIDEFENYLPRLIDDSLAKITFIEPLELKNRLKKASEYFTMGRKPLHGEFMLHAYQGLVKHEVVNDQLLHKIQIVVATLEILIRSASFVDDFDDNAKIRCGKPCWHLLDGNGPISAVLDTFYVRGFTEEIIRENFKGDMRDSIIMIYNRICFITAIGQYFDVMGSQSRDYDHFTMEQLNACYKYKSSFYAVKAPILLALTLSNKLDERSYNIVENVCNEIGILMHIHNDTIDYLNTIDSVKGKTGSDIQMGKCSWVAVAVLERCNPEQRRIFVENYGSKDPEKFDRILQLYEEMDILKMYQQEEQERYDAFLRKVNALPEDATPSANFFKKFSNFVRQYAIDIL